jgi:hypothetical protein
MGVVGVTRVTLTGLAELQAARTGKMRIPAFVIFLGVNHTPINSKGH